jgi:diguanylate cyclase (GGDEF)-like protein
VLWPALGGLALAAVFVAWMRERWGGEYVTNCFDDLTELVVALAAAAACCFAAARTGPAGRSRRAWSLLAVSCLSWGLGQAVWSYFELVRRVQVPFPSWGDVGFLLAVPFAVAAVLSFPSAGTTAGGRARSLLDGAIVATSVLALGWATALGGAFHSTGGRSLGAVISLAYPLGDVVIVTITVLALVRARDGLRGPFGLMAAGLLALAVSDSLFAYFTQTHSYGANTDLLDTGWVVGYLLIALAALAGAGHRGDHPDPPSSTPARGARALVPYLPLVLAAGVTGFQIVEGHVGPFLAWAMVTAAALTMARQFVTLLDNASLISQLRAQQSELHRLALHDDLTDLANRSLFWDRLTHAHAHAQRQRGGVAVLMCDLDGFKHINDTYGHAGGDALLVAAAERLRACARREDTPARLGGDEFAVVVETGSRPELAVLVARRLIAAMETPFRIGGYDVSATMSIGLSQSDTSAATPDDLLREADAALYLAKRQGKARFQTYQDVLSASGPTATDDSGAPLLGVDS